MAQRTSAAAGIKPLELSASMQSVPGIKSVAQADHRVRCSARKTICAGPHQHRSMDSPAAMRPMFALTGKLNTLDKQEKNPSLAET
jgi:hypothetical protein